jgi:hypothetical protein
MDDPLSLGERNADLTDVCLFESISDDDLSSVGGDYEEDQKKDPSQPRRIKKVERGRQKKRIVFYDLKVDQTSPAVSGISNDAEWGMDWDGHEEDSREIDEDDCVTRPPDIDLDDVKKGLQSVLRSYDKTHTSSSPSKDDQERVKLCRWAKEARMPSQRKGSGITSMDSKPLPESPKTDSPPKHPELIVLKSRSLGSTPSKKRVNHALGEAQHCGMRPYVSLVEDADSEDLQSVASAFPHSSHETPERSKAYRKRRHTPSRLARRKSIIADLRSEVGDAQSVGELGPEVPRARLRTTSRIRRTKSAFVPNHDHQNRLNIDEIKMSDILEAIRKDKARLQEKEPIVKKSITQWECERQLLLEKWRRQEKTLYAKHGRSLRRLVVCDD